MNFETKNNGNNIKHKSGFIREDKSDKVDYTLIPLEELKRVAELYTRGAKIYGRYNWSRARGKELESFKQSAFRHFIQWLNGEKDEDHMAAIVFNIFGYEYCLSNGSNKGGSLQANNCIDYDGGPIDPYRMDNGNT